MKYKKLSILSKWKEFCAHEFTYRTLCSFTEYLSRFDFDSNPYWPLLHALDERIIIYCDKEHIVYLFVKETKEEKINKPWRSQCVCVGAVVRLSPAHWDQVQWTGWQSAARRCLVVGRFITWEVKFWLGKWMRPSEMRSNPLDDERNRWRDEEKVVGPNKFSSSSRRFLLLWAKREEKSDQDFTAGWLPGRMRRLPFRIFVDVVRETKER